MIRTPLRPLARILAARAAGENPDAIERENLRIRHEDLRDRARARAEGRLFILAVFFFAAFGTVGIRMGVLASTPPAEPRTADAGAPILATRADIEDRNGRLLATNLVTYSLYAQPPQMVDPARAVDGLMAIFPDLDRERLLRDFTGARTFVWIKRRISPEQMQAVHDIGDPGLLFGPREMRLYPNGPIASHILGGAGFGREGVHSAEIVGTAGVEKTFDTWLRDPANQGQPLRLSLDLTVQAAVEQVLEGGMALMNAKGATAILMEADTGAIVALASLPDFDPNDRPVPPVQGNPEDSPIFNRAVLGVYELGSTFKVFAIAQALELGLVNPSTQIDTTTPMRWGRHRISDFRNYGPQLSVTDVIVKSSNVGTARVALQIGGARFRGFLERLGFMVPTSIEMAEANRGRPLFRSGEWPEITTMTVSYGHGLSASPLHLAAAYATIVNGGYKVAPTLRADAAPARGERVISQRTSEIMRDLLRQTVSRGTATFADIEGYAVGGKTGTADKPRASGGYYDDKVIATFAGVFPAHDPRYVLVLTLDEPVDTTGSEPRRTAGWTAVPVAGEVIRRVGPLLGLRPEVESASGNGVTLVRN